MTELDPSDLPDQALKSALEFAVTLAVVGSRTKPPVPFPAGLKQFLKFQKLPAGALPVVRAAVEGDPAFFERMAAMATLAAASMVDEVGTLWITRPLGWLEAARSLVAAAPTEEPTDARGERRRREAAEAAAGRARQNAVEIGAALVRERELLREATAEHERLAKALGAAQSKVRELESGARRRAAGSKAVADRADVVADEVATLRARLAEAEEARDAGLAARAQEPSNVDADRMRTVLLEALALTGPMPDTDRRAKRRVARTPLAIPGGMYASSGATAEHLLRSAGVLVLLDGYNVAKLGWPDVQLVQQRELCVRAAETLARRWGADIHVVFDGADIVGAHAPGRRLVRVTFSPQGVSADDVLRAQVAALDPNRAVVVVTNDNAVLADVRASGANTISSDAFLALARR